MKIPLDEYLVVLTYEAIYSKWAGAPNRQLARIINHSSSDSASTDKLFNNIASIPA